MLLTEVSLPSLLRLARAGVVARRRDSTFILSLRPRRVVLHQHAKGCHCKKSGCLKKYCECFQANITCGPNCKCLVRGSGADTLLR